MPSHLPSRVILLILVFCLTPSLRAQDTDEPFPTGAIARLGTTRLVHLGGLASVAVSPDGKVVASGVKDGKQRDSEIFEGFIDLFEDDRDGTLGFLRLWDVGTGKMIREIATPDSPVSTLTFDGDGKTLYAGCGKFIAAFNVANGKMLWHQLANPGTAGRYEITKIVVTKDKIVTIHKGHVTCLERTENSVSSVQPQQQAVRFWNRQTGKPMAHPDSVESTVKTCEKSIPKLLHDVALSPDGRFAALVFSEAKPVNREDRHSAWDVFHYLKCEQNLIDLGTGKCIQSVPCDQSIRDIRCLTFSSDGEQFAYLQKQDIWLVQTATQKTKLLVKSDEAVRWRHDLAFVANERLAAKNHDGTFHVWDTTTGKVVDDPAVGDHRFGGASGGKVSASIFANTIQLAETDTGRPLHAFAGHRGTPLIRFALHTKNALLSREGKQAMLWDTRSWKFLRSLAKETWGSFAYWRMENHYELDSWESLEKQLFVRRTEKGMELRDAKYGQIIRRLEIKSDTGYAARFSASGNRVFTHGEIGVYIFDVATGKRISTIPAERVYYLATSATDLLSPDGKLFAKYDLGISIYDVDASKKFCDLTPEFLSDKSKSGTVAAFQFSDDGKSVVAEVHERLGTGLQRIAICVWDLPDGKVVRELTYLSEHTYFDRRFGAITACIPAFALSPDRRLIALAAKDSRKIEIWEVASGAKRGELAGHVGSVADLAFSPDGKQLVSSSEDTTILVWDLMRPLQPVKLANRLSADELAVHVKTLFQPDAAKADVAIWRLIAAAEDSVPFLKTRLKPVERPDPKRVQQLMHDLDHNDFQTRSRAQTELGTLGELVLADIEAALKENNPIERKRRLQALQEEARKSAEPFGTDVRVGHHRVLEVLEKIGTAAAIDHVRAIAEGAPGAQLTLAAQATLARGETTKQR